jgi:two-component system cell cycle response regulator DivK
MKVLAVDDNLLNLKLITTLLESRGHDVLAISTPMTVVAEARAFHPDLILLDIAMPDRDGIEVMHDLRGCADLRGLPIHALTAHSTDSLHEHVGENGFTSIVRKPCSMDRLLELLGEAALRV